MPHPAPVLDSDFAPLMAWLKTRRPSRIALVMDPNTERGCLPHLVSVLPDDVDFLCLSEEGEAVKSLDNANALWQALDNAGYDRNSVLIGLGGGTVTDLTGFVASTFMRGIDFWLIPTTLLSMVDAAIGGKTGINLQSGKNRVGTFAFPSGVSLNPDFLATLPTRHLRAGLAEHIKHILLTGDEARVQSALQAAADALQSESPASFGPIIEESAAIKMDIVAQDERERSGHRKLLNLGHTAGHALESWALKEGHDLLHGEAVSWGLRFALHLSADRLGNEGPAAQSLLSLADALKQLLPCPVAPPPAEILWEWAVRDKKNRGRDVLLVLLEAPGKPLIDERVRFPEFERGVAMASN